MSWSGQETLQNVREWWESLPDLREALQLTGSSQEALSDVWEWSGGRPGCLNGRDAVPVVQQLSGGPPSCLGVVGRLSRM